MTSVSAPLRRIAVHAAGSNMDLVVPAGDALGHALSVAGLRLAPGDHVHGPGGAPVDPQTSAAELVEGGLYSVTRGRAPTNDTVRDAASGDRYRTLPWMLAASALAASGVALLLSDSLLRWIAAGVLGVTALIAALIAGARTTEHSSGLSLVPGLLLGALSGLLCAPNSGTGINAPVWNAMFAVALAFAGVAVIGVVLSATARAAAVRAGSAAISVIAVLGAVAAALSPLIGWGPKPFAIAVAAASVLAIRALPALLVGAEDGYFIDYSKFMSLRWTVRGRVPRYIERVENDRVRNMVVVTEFRLRASILMLSMLAVPGIAVAALQLMGGNLLERIGAGAFLVFAIGALMLVSRRTVARNLRRPQRLAALGGLIGAALTLVLSGALPVIALVIGAGVLALIGAIIAAGTVPILSGARSLGWSRTGDIVESITVVLVMPAGLIAAGAIEVLRGVLS